MIRAPYTCNELAIMLGLTRETFYKSRKRLHANHGLPAPLPGGGHAKWDRAVIDAWLRHETKKITPANDLAPLGLDQQRAAISVHYRERARAAG